MSTTNTGEDADAPPSQSTPSPPSKSEQTTVDEESNKKSESNNSGNKKARPQPPSRRRYSSRLARSISQKNLVDKGDQAFYIDEEGNVHDVKVMDKDNDSSHPMYKIKLPDETVKEKVNHTEVFKTHPTVHNILCVLDLDIDTDVYLREEFPTVTQFETFLNISSEAVKAYRKPNGKEPRFKRKDREEFTILSRFAKKNVDDKGNVDWEKFNERDFDTLREEAPKEDLCKVLKELCINRDEVVDVLKAKSVLTPAHFVRKPESWFSKLEIVSNLEVDSDDLEQNGQHTNRPLLNETEKSEIERFKQWYTSHFIGYLPSEDWVVSFRNDEMQKMERDLRKVLCTIGLSADVVHALKMNNIRDFEALNEESKYWRTPSTSSEEQENESNKQEDESNTWFQMGLEKNEAKSIINFRHWYKFYIAGRSGLSDWASEFNMSQYVNFLQRYQPGDNFTMLYWWKFWENCKFWQPDSLRFPQERFNYHETLKKAVNAGDISNEQRYHLKKYYEEKREKIALMEEITSNHFEGLGGTSQQEKRLHELLQEDDRKADKKKKDDLFFHQKFCQFFFSATLVLTLLDFWLGTTIWFMIQYFNERRATAWAMDDERRLQEPTLSLSPSSAPSLGSLEKYEQHPGYEYVAFVHNILFGLVSAVVIQELGEESRKTSLYYRFVDTYLEKRKRKKEGEF